MYEEELHSFVHDWHYSIDNDALDIGVTYIISLTSYNSVGLHYYVFDELKYDMSDPAEAEVKISVIFHITILSLLNA